MKGLEWREEEEGEVVQHDRVGTHAHRHTPLFYRPSCVHSTTLRKVLLATQFAKPWLGHQNLLDKFLCLYHRS